MEKEIILKTATLLLGGLIRAEFNRAVEKGGIPKTIKFDTLNEARKVALPYSWIQKQEDAAEIHRNQREIKKSKIIWIYITNILKNAAFVALWKELQLIFVSYSD